MRVYTGNAARVTTNTEKTFLNFVLSATKQYSGRLEIVSPNTYIHNSAAAESRFRTKKRVYEPFRVLIVVVCSLAKTRYISAGSPFWHVLASHLGLVATDYLIGVPE